MISSRTGVGTMTLKRCSPLVRALLAIGFSASTILAQSPPPREKPKLKDFGESLKRLKWDPQLNAAIETKPPHKDASAGDRADVVKIETSLVASDVLVLDQSGQPVTGLTANDFVITEDGKPQKVGMLSLGDNAAVPRSIVLIIDYSPSQFPYIQTSSAAARTLVDKLAPLDRMAIVTDDVELLVDFTDDKKKLKDALNSLVKRVHPDFNSANPAPPRSGLSKQYSALMATLKEAFSDEDQRPIIIFQTDGDELSLLQGAALPSVAPNLPRDLREMEQRRIDAWLKRGRASFSRNDLYKAVEQSRATIYTVVPGFRMVGLPPAQQVAQLRAQWEFDALAQSRVMGPRSVDATRKYWSDRWKRTPPEAIQFYIDDELKVQASLAMVATLTGGWTEFLERPEQADEIYSRIFSDINRRYIVGYYPINKEHDGKRRKLHIEVQAHPEYTVMTRKAYYAAEPE
jgi:VWFA-related protein